MKKSIIALLMCVFTTVTIAQNYKFGKVSKSELEEKFYPLDSTADAAYLHKYRRTYYDYNKTDGAFNVVNEVYDRIKIYNEEGFEEATRYIYYYNPDKGEEENISSIKAYTFNYEEGKVVKSKLSKKNIFKEKKNKFWSVLKITLPNVKKGCVIDIKYKITSPYYNKIDDVDFQFNIPTKDIDVNVSIPEFYKFKSVSKGYFHIAPKASTKNSFISYRNKVGRNDAWRGTSTSYQDGKIEYVTFVKSFKAKNIPALKDNEPFIGSVKSYRGGVKFELKEIDFTKVGGSRKFYSNDWGDVSKQIYANKSFGGELSKSNYYKKDLIAVLSKTKTESDKIIAVFNYVKLKVKWNTFYGMYTDKGVRRAYKESVGNTADINLMLTSMLRTAGLNANPVLVSTRSHGVPFFPTLDGFNYVISMVEMSNGGYVLLDATEPYSVPNILPRRALNWNGRKIVKGGASSWVKLTSSKHALEENTLMVNFSDDFSAQGVVRSKFDNLSALSYRKNNNHIKEESVITRLEEKLNIEIEDFKITNKVKIGKPLVRTVKFNAEDLIEDINGKLYISPLLFLTEHKNPFKLNERKFPVDFTTPWKVKNNAFVQIPKGYKVEKLPENLAIGLPEDMGVFKYMVKEHAGKVKTMCVLQFNKAVIPSQYYLTLKEFYKNVVEKQTERIVFVKE